MEKETNECVFVLLKRIAQVQYCHLLEIFVSVQANIDILEANKGSNKEEIRRLRAENKDIRLKLSQLVRGGAHGDEVFQSSWLSF